MKKGKWMTLKKKISKEKYFNKNLNGLKNKLHIIILLKTFLKRFLKISLNLNLAEVHFNKN